MGLTPDSPRVGPQVQNLDQAPSFTIYKGFATVYFSFINQRVNPDFDPS